MNTTSSDPPPGDVTQLLLDWNQGVPDTLNRLLPLVYHQLRQIAKNAAFHHGGGHRTLQPTALVHEAYLRLIDETRVEWHNRVHFYAIAAREIRRILIDEYRRKHADKRGGELERISLANVNLPVKAMDVDLLALNQALDELAVLDEREVRIIELHYFGGLTNEEIGVALGISVKTVERDLSHAKRWLRHKLTS